MALGTVSVMFQHTAARRRLPPDGPPPERARVVSTHSRPKAAARHPAAKAALVGCFNTQPPEGGCPDRKTLGSRPRSFQHTAARRRLPGGRSSQDGGGRFNTQPPEGGCVGPCAELNPI